MDHPVHEGDFINLFCCDAKGYVFAQFPRYNCVSIFPVSDPEQKSQLRDPVIPNTHFASFQVVAENYVSNNSPLQRNGTFTFCTLVYGRKVKFLHIASNMYLSYDESPQKSVTLTSDYNERCLFRILPYSANKSRGENVMPKDQIMLESVSDKGKLLLCTSNIVSSRCELKMCNTESIFIISLHSCNHIELPDKALRGCDVIMLFNYVQEAYLSGYGSVVEEFLPEAIKGDPIITEVGARKAKSVNGIQQEPPLGGDCFWQFEKVLCPLNGNAISYSDHCRIKHILTQQYLAVTQRRHQKCLTLKRIEAGGIIDPEISFKLIPDIERTDVVTKGYYIKINHIQSGMNLSVRSILHSYRNSKWFKLGLEDDKNSNRQYFQVTEVKPVVIHDFYYICGVNSQLRETMQKLMAVSKPFSYSPSLDELIKVMGQFLEWFQRRGCLNRHNLKLKAFKKSQGIDLLVGFLHESESQKYKENFMYLNFEKLCDVIADILLEFVSSAKSKSLLYLTEERLIGLLIKKCISNIKFKRFLTNLTSNESVAALRIVQQIDLDEMLLLLKNTVRYACTFISRFHFDLSA